MKVADLNRSGNPSSQDLSTVSAVRESLDSIDAIAEQLKQAVLSAAENGDSFDAVERNIHQTVFRLGKQAIELFIGLQGQGDLGPSITTEQGDTLRRIEKISTTTVRSIFGTHRFQQFTYAPGPKKAVALRPISARMSLPNRQWSYLLQEFSQMLSVDSAYGQAMSDLGRILGGRFAVDTAEKINADMGQAAGEFLGDLPKPEPGTEARLLVASADCKGVPLVREDAPKVAAFETAKKHPGNRRMATVASVYTVDAHPRTAEEITAALFRDAPQEDVTQPKRPQPQHKNTTAHFPEVADDGVGGELHISGIHVAMAWIVGQIGTRRRPGQVLIALMDGQSSLWETMKLHVDFGSRTIPILDILHALSYVWKAAGLFEKSDEKRQAFTRTRLLRILRGEVKGVIQGLRRMGTTAKLSGKNAKRLSKICGYLERNADRMRYDEYLRRGYPIASGVIEGACRHLVKDRMERSGMRWTLEGARSMLNVRAVFQSDHWTTFLDHRIEQEVKHTHPHRKLLDGYALPSSMMLAC